MTTAADHSDSSETTAAGDGVTAKPVRRRVSAATKGKGDDRSSNEDGVEDAETSGTNERSRERASSVSSLYGHPAQTRAYVVQAAHDMGYDPRGPPHIQGGERGRLLERGRTGSAGAGEYGTIADTNHAAKTHDHAHDHSHGDHDHDHAHEDVEAGGKSATKTSRGWFGQKKVVAEDDDDHLPSATSAVAHSPAAGHGHSHGHSHGEGSMNMRGVFLHVLGDALGNVGVIGSGLFILLTSYSWRFYTDPLISFIITIIIFSSALPLGE